MTKGVSAKTFLLTYLILATTWLLTGCDPDKNKVDTSHININITADRLENDLLQHGDNIEWLKNKYQDFFTLYTTQIINLGVTDTTDTVLLKKKLDEFITDADIKNIYDDSRKIYNNFDSLNQEFTDAFRHYNYYFPEKIIPRVITFISGFNFGLVSADSALGVGLDMYLGKDSRFYASLQLPQYKVRKMDKHYIVADAMRGWAQTEWVENPAAGDFISQLIYQGKMLYFLEFIMPDAPDSIRTGYTQQQVEWCRNNEKSIWAFFVDHNLLFVTDASQTAKYTGDGPTTGGFPKESPGNIGQWMGYAIVQSYMKQQPEMTLKKLMEEQDYKKIFRDSKYKPKK